MYKKKYLKYKKKYLNFRDIHKHGGSHVVSLEKIYEEKYKEIQKCYEDVINQPQYCDYKWNITVQSSDFKLCFNKKEEATNFIMYRPIIGNKPPGVFFSPNLLTFDSTSRERTINWIDWIIENKHDLRDYNPDKTKITAIGINKNNILTYRGGALVINEVCSLPPSKKNIFLINSVESLIYFTDTYIDFTYPNEYNTITWIKFIQNPDNFSGLELDLMKLYENKKTIGYKIENKYTWYNTWDVDQTIIFFSDAYDICFTIVNTIGGTKYNICHDEDITKLDIIDEINELIYKTYIDIFNSENGRLFTFNYIYHTLIIIVNTELKRDKFNEEIIKYRALNKELKKTDWIFFNVKNMISEIMSVSFIKKIVINKILDYNYVPKIFLFLLNIIDEDINTPFIILPDHENMTLLEYMQFNYCDFDTITNSKEFNLYVNILKNLLYVKTIKIDYSLYMWLKEEFVTKKLGSQFLHSAINKINITKTKI